MVEKDIQKYKDIILAIKKKVNATAAKTQSRSELKLYLEAIGIVNLDYIADLPVYRFTEEEKKKVEEKLKAANAELRGYKKLLASKAERSKVYVAELQEVAQKFKKGNYT